MYQHVATTHCSNKSLHAYWIIFMKIFFSATEFCRRKKLHKFSLIMIFCNLLWRQRFLQKFSRTHKVICRCDVSLQHVAATSHATCTRARVICQLGVLLQLFTWEKNALQPYCSVPPNCILCNSCSFLRNSAALRSNSFNIKIQ